jgi:peptidoglycan/LPS O-acetylase OafA/YrhL
VTAEPVAADVVAAVEGRIVDIQPDDPMTHPGLTRLFTHDNAFGLLRLTFALLVLVTHAYHLGGFGAEPMWAWTANQISFGTVAVGGFFVISGFLITASGRSNDVLQFMWKRILRIFPAFWFLLVLTAFVVAPVVFWRAKDTLNSYMTQAPSPVEYVTNNFLLEVNQYGIGNMLTKTPYGEAVNASVFNGSIWSLIYEFRCYIAVAILLVLGVLARARWIIAMVAALFFLGLAAINVSPATKPAVLTVVGDMQMLQMGFLFAIGATISVYAAQIKCNAYTGAVAFAIMIGTAVSGWFFPVGAVAFAYFVLWLAMKLPQTLRKVGRKHDISYGVYLYGFLVQQLLAVVAFYRYGFLAYLAASIVFSVICGALSWHLVERHAMRLKKRGPGRGIAYWWGSARDRWKARFARSSAA